MSALVQSAILQRLESLEEKVKSRDETIWALRQELESLERRMQAREGLHNLDLQTMQMMSSRLRALETRTTLIEVRLPAPPPPLPAGAPQPRHGPPLLTDDEGDILDEAPLQVRVPLTNEELAELLNDTTSDEEEVAPAPPADHWGFRADEL